MHSACDQSALAIRPHTSELAARWREIGAWRDITLAQALATAAWQHTGARAIFHSASRPAVTTVGEMHRRGLALASALQRIGVRQGDCVALQVPTWIEGAWLLHAAAALGCTIVPLVHILGPAEVSYILRAAGARIFVTPDRWRNIDYLERLSKLDHIPTLERVIVIGEHGPRDAVLWKDLLAAAGGEVQPSAARADDLAVLLYTSGTTSAPKGVEHSSQTLLAEMHTLQQARAEPQAVTLGPWPAGHIAGLMTILHCALDGAPTIFMDQWDANDAAALIERHAIRSMSATPYHLTSLLDAAATLGHDIGTLYDCLVGATTVPPQLVARCQALGLATYRSYGSTEHPTVTTGHPADPLNARLSTDGRCTLGNEVRIVDDDGQDVLPGRDGEVVTRGPELFIGYRDTQTNRQAFLPGGWFLTGDVGQLDPTGQLTITDRKKDIIIRGGENISSRAVEDILLKHPAIADVAAVAMADKALGER
ncbi:MAG: AMP-binding protein, partial [Steroidobacteraceae bacterium]